MAESEQQRKEPDWSARLAEQQRKLDIQINALEQLEAEFISRIWSDSPLSKAEHLERNDKLIELLDSAELPPHMVLRLFYMLEYKAAQEVGKATALAQTIQPDCLADKLPDLLINNALLVREHAFTSRRSEQNSRAAKKPRPGRRNIMHPLVEHELQLWIDQGRFVCGRRGDKSAFVDYILSDSRFGQDRRQTVFDLIKNYLEK